MIWSRIVLVISFLVIVRLAVDAVRVFRSPQYKREAAMLRSEKRLRKAAKR
jgi:hypothetical protein